MPFDFAPERRPQLENPRLENPRLENQRRGRLNYHAGLAAEDVAAMHYETTGYAVLERRWRGIGGEIDLICRGADGFVFVEVKKADNFANAACHLSFAQLNRIALAAEEYIGTVANAPLTPMRLDLAMVNGTGEIETLENLTLY